MRLRQTVPLLESLLEQHRAVLGADHTAYRNHCCRVFHFATALGVAPADEELLAIALAFHDLGIWTHGTLDYLGPSEQLARDWLATQGRSQDADRVAAMIANHHKVSAYPGDALVEAMRRADLVDVSLGLVRFSIPRDEVRAVQRLFPDAGFHWRLVQLTGRQLLRDPRHPLPMFRR